MKKTAFMTMDVESFFDAECLSDKNIQYDVAFSMEEFSKNYIDLLDKYKIKGTFFIVSSSLEKSGQILKDAFLNGHKMALHGLNHKSPFDMSAAEFKSNTQKGRQELEQFFGCSINGFRAPCFGINDGLLKIVKDLGFEYDSSSLNFEKALKSGTLDLKNFQKNNSLVYTDKNSFTEYCLPKEKFFGKKIPVGGGAYIRLFPWFIAKNLLKKYIRKNDTYVFYVHPFEIAELRIPHLKNISIFEKMYLSLFRKSYLKKIEWIIKFLKKNGFEFDVMGKTA